MTHSSCSDAMPRIGFRFGSRCGRILLRRACPILMGSLKYPCPPVHKKTEFYFSAYIPLPFLRSFLQPSPASHIRSLTSGRPDPVASSLGRCMVFPPVEGPPDTTAAAAGAGEEPQSSNLLHNFSFPNVKRWGDRRILRCANVNRKDEIIGGDRRPSPPAAVGERRGLRAGARIGGCDDDADGGLEEFREKLMGHLREAVDWIKIGVAPRRLGGKAEEDVPVPTPVRPTEAESEPVRPWNLRTTTACKSPISNPASMTGALERAGRERTIRLRSEGSNKRDRRPKFSVALTREEIEEDIYAVTVSRPRRRPRKRPRIVQKQLDDLFPGSRLSEITADSYKVPDD